MVKLQEHSLAKKTLLDWYDRILQHGVLLGLDEDEKSVGSATLREQKETLLAERFVVAICGQMNAGKSTLLNALLFRDEILPASPTTMTAKIALLDGGKPPHIQATLYSKEEFDLVVAASNKDNVARDELTRAREASIQAGLQERDLLRRPPRIERRDNLKQLQEFVAVPDDGGLYTPYVSSVNVTADIPWLYEVTVADTPGTNDPNPERDKITRDWIKRADAVVYVTYAGQAGMNADDIRFIDDYLLHVDARRRIIAVNKCDSLSDSGAVWSHLESLRIGGSVRMQELLGDRGGIVLVSGLGGLIECMESDGRALSEGLIEWRSMLNNRGFLDPEKHSINALRSLIEDRIIKTRGESVIRSHRSKLGAVFDRINNRLENELSQWRGELVALQSSAEELSKQRRAVDKAISDVSEAIQEHKQKLIHRKFVERVSQSEKKRDKLKEDCIENVEESLKRVEHVDHIAAQAMWAVRSHVTSAKPDITRAVLDAIKEMEEDLNSAVSDLNEELVTSGFDIPESRRRVLYVTSQSIVGNLKEESPCLILEELEALVVASANSLGRMFNTTASRNKAIEKVMIELKPEIENKFDDIWERIKNQIMNALLESLSSSETRILTLLDQRRKLLEDIKSGAKSSKSEMERITKACASHEARLAEVNVLHSQFREATR
jgi:hypothetical protein